MWPSDLTLAMTLTLNFHGQIWNLLYLSQKWSDYHETKSKHISIELQASNVTSGFDLDHNLDLWILKVKCDLDLCPHIWPWPWIVMVKFWNSCISEWEGQLTLHKGRGSRSFMTMTTTIWWQRSGVWIYQIVTGVTSVVGMPSTHLVGSDNGLLPGWRQAIIWTNDSLLSIGNLATNFSEILIEIQTFSSNKMHLKMSSAKWQPLCQP